MSALRAIRRAAARRAARDRRLTPEELEELGVLDAAEALAQSEGQTIARRMRHAYLRSVVLFGRRTAREKFEKVAAELEQPA